MKKLVIPVFMILFLILLFGFNLESRFESEQPVLVGNTEATSEKIRLIDVDIFKSDDILTLLGEPEEYLWGDNTYTKDDLPDFYIMKYSDDFNIWIVGNTISELRFYGDSYQMENSLQVGMKLKEVLSIVGTPTRTVEDGSNNFEDYTLYKDIGGNKGYCYYSSPDLNVRMFFTDYEVNALYVTRTDQNEYIEDFQETNSANLKRINTDETDLPFVDDPEVLGKWNSVDFVDEIEDFDPTSPKWTSDLYLKELNFKENGELFAPYLMWTKGIMMHHNDKTASEYIIKAIDGSTYLFLEWKSGDYVYRDMKPSYYVMKKAD